MLLFAALIWAGAATALAGYAHWRLDRQESTLKAIFPSISRRLRKLENEHVSYGTINNFSALNNEQVDNYLTNFPKWPYA
jgi:hypothetical protein